MTDAPDETTSPDDTSDPAAGPRDHADRAPSSTVEESTADAAPAEAGSEAAAVVPAVPRPPRPGQRVPRRATAPSPRTAPAVVVAPTPPRLKSTPVAAPASRPSGGTADGEGEAAATAARPPRVRRRTRVQRAAGSAEPVAATQSAAPSEADEDRTAETPVAGAPTTSAPGPATPDDVAATQPDQDGLSELRGMFADDEPQPVVAPVDADAEDQDEAPTDDAATADGSRASSVEVEQDVSGVRDAEEVVQ